MNKRSNYVGRRRYFIYFLIFLMCTINYADRSALSVGIPKISAEFHLSSVDQGWLLSSYLWTYVLCLVPSALAVDKWGSKRMATFSVACWSLATMMTGMVWNFGSLIVARLLLGVTELPCFPIGHRAIREWAPASERGLASTVFTSGILAGIAFGALLSGWLISLLGWRICFLIFGAMGFVWLAVWMVVFKDPSQVRWLHQSEREKVLSSRAFDKSPKDERISIRVLLSQKSMWGTHNRPGLRKLYERIFPDLASLLPEQDPPYLDPAFRGRYGSMLRRRLCRYDFTRMGFGSGAAALWIALRWSALYRGDIAARLGSHGLRAGTQLAERASVPSHLLVDLHAKLLGK